mmetsp:Transcript_35409/g.43366  ORF Transcript_35409/g.43366 Transcript_35409/m.43366 type:complete len:339 (-) Transcript_35409:121-1137(-)
MIDTGNKLRGQPIRFGENAVAFRAPQPHIGAFDIPRPLMDEAFLGERNMHRLHQLHLIELCQGKWETNIPIFPPTLKGVTNDQVECKAVNASGSPIHCFKGPDNFVYDGCSDSVGTIRIKWRVAKTQNMSVIAEAVRPGRPHNGSYGSTGITMQSNKEIRRQFFNELFECEEVCEPLNRPRSAAELKLVNNKRWTLTPFHVTASPMFPCLSKNGQLVGRLWMISQGLKDSREFFAMCYDAESYCLWIVRLITGILLFCGWMEAFGPIVREFVWIPFGYLVSLSFVFAAFILSVTCWFGCTTLACFTARPISCTVGIVSLCGLHILFYRERQGAINIYN